MDLIAPNSSLGCDERFFTKADLKAGAAQDDHWQLIKDNTTWISGHSNVADNTLNFSTYDVLAVVIIAGGRMTQSYMALRLSTEDDNWLHFWIRPDDNCESVDDFKYGLASKFPTYATASARALEREGIIERYNGCTI
ncbi:hypothetical protein EDD85DRAFT_1025275 [Armillaria nabsnona]|nr:hypothetical protein EDD85DRAFT_1025275 [Armillaria nabsnona]